MGLVLQLLTAWLGVKDFRKHRSKGIERRDEGTAHITTAAEQRAFFLLSRNIIIRTWWISDSQ